MISSVANATRNESATRQRYKALICHVKVMLHVCIAFAFSTCRASSFSLYYFFSYFLLSTISHFLSSTLDGLDLLAFSHSELI
jgi:hypothetical protein